MKVTKLIVGELAENCYIIEYGEKQAAVVDPGAEGEAIASKLDESGLTITMILLTHGHFDHIGAVQFLKERYGAKVYIGRGDECMLSDRDKSGAVIAPFIPFTPSSADVLLEDGQEISLGAEKLKIITTPGHSEGSICYVGEGIMFVGDTVFKGSVGRTDLYSGSKVKQDESIQKLKSVKEDYILYCGHGDDSSLKYEKQFNPYFILNLN